MHIIELKGLGYTVYEIKEIIEIAKKKNIKLVHTNRKQIEEVNIIKNKRNIPYRDILHSILARDNEAIMVCTDRHFEFLKDIARIIRPKDLI